MKCQIKVKWKHPALRHSTNTVENVDDQSNISNTGSLISHLLDRQQAFFLPLEFKWVHFRRNGAIQGNCTVLHQHSQGKWSQRQAGLGLHMRSPKGAQDTAGSGHNHKAKGHIRHTPALMGSSVLNVWSSPASRPAASVWRESQYPCPCKGGIQLHTWQA